MARSLTRTVRHRSPMRLPLWQRVSAYSYGVPHLMSSGPRLALTKGSLVDRHDLALITATRAGPIRCIGRE